jgi:hypothetical protein
VSTDSSRIDISGLSKAAVLAALYNGSRQFGMGFMHSRGQSEMTEEEAQKLIDSGDDPDYADKRRELYFDYLHGRVLKVNLAGDSFSPSLYDRDVGQGAAARAIEKLRGSK